MKQQFLKNKTNKLIKLSPISGEAFASVIIAAGGSFSRMNGVNKQLAEICGVPVIIRSALAFEHCREVSEIVIVSREEDFEELKALCERYKITKLSQIVKGGENRFKSVKNGFRSISCKAKVVLVHDGARPFISSEKISELIEKAKKFGAAIPAVAVRDTVKICSSGAVKETPERSKFMLAQTPQVFLKSLYEEMVKNGTGEETDDAQIAENLGAEVFVVEGEYKNIKITSKEDLLIGEVFCND